MTYSVGYWNPVAKEWLSSYASVYRKDATSMAEFLTAKRSKRHLVLNAQGKILAAFDVKDGTVIETNEWNGRLARG